MADRNALGKIGLMFVAATLLVMTMGAVVVAGHISGEQTFDDEGAFGASAVMVETK